PAHPDIHSLPTRRSSDLIYYWRLRTMARTVQCVKLGKELPGLEKQPFPGPLGERIYENVSAEGYALWQPHLTTIINHYGLNPARSEEHTSELQSRENLVC